MTNKLRRVAVLGGGITGLSAAFYLQKLGAERGESIEVTVLEGSERLGGRIHTLRRDGFVIERGPDSFLARKLPMIELAKELGIAGELTGTNPAAKKTYISLDGKLHPMPEGLTLGIPTNVDKFLKTDLVSGQGKGRALEEQQLPPTEGKEDESVGAFLERRMGREMVERIFEPLLAGIHAGDLYQLGLRATFPQFKQLEQEYGGLIRGMTETSKKAALANAVEPAPALATTPTAVVETDPLPASIFMTFRRGLSTVIEALDSMLRADGCDIRMGTRVVSLEQALGAGSLQPAYRLRLSDDSMIEADAVICTLPAYAAAKLLTPHIDVSALMNIKYVSVANVVFGYDDAGFDHDLDGSGFLVPRGEGRRITASTWTSSKWLHTAPKGKRLIRCYVGRAGDEKGVELSDEKLTEEVRQDLHDLIGLTAAPEFVEITRLRHSMPQYPVGHIGAIASLREHLAAQLPGVVVTGAAFGGVGLPDCVAQGKKAAEALLKIEEV
ncbi:protoporphyrinogen oxidase [Cohnella sp.]|uniref:protoporphyrinogen oxidase n=1 Tax=Cohnella sp. TaxID=1883426 RepID=UPI0035616A20